MIKNQRYHICKVCIFVKALEINHFIMGSDSHCEVDIMEIKQFHYCN